MDLKTDYNILAGAGWIVLLVIFSLLYKNLVIVILAWLVFFILFSYLRKIEVIYRGKSFLPRGNTSAKLLVGALLILLILPTVGIGMYEYESLKYLSDCADRISPNATLCHCDFRWQNLSGKDLQGADLSYANLENANLQNANLEGAILRNASMAGADLTGAVLKDAVLDGADLQNVIGLTDSMLLSALNVQDYMLAAALSQRGIRLESHRSIIKDLKNVCMEVGVTGCVPYTPDNSFHPMVLLDEEGGWHKLTYQVPDNWAPMALRFCQLVACVGEEEKVYIDQQAYGFRPYLTVHYVKRYGYRVHVRLLAAYTGAVVAQEYFTGRLPEFPEVVDQDTDRIVGDHVEFKDMSLWLATFVNPPARVLSLYSSLDLFLSRFLSNVPLYLSELLGRGLVAEGQIRNIDKRR